MQGVKVSFVVPTYNRIAWISECVQSLRVQTLKDIEVIVVDDCSTDSTEKVMQWFCEQDKRIVYVKNEKNMGAGESRNIGNKLAKADIICVCDSDDFYPDYRAESTYKYLMKHKNVDMVNGSYYRVDYSNNITKEFKSTDIDLKLFSKKQEFYFCHPSAAYRRKDILKLPYKHETNGMTDDYMLVKDWLAKGRKIRAVDEIWCFHRVLPNSIMHKMRGNLE